MPSISNILERLRWKVGLGLVIVAAGFAASAAPSADIGSADVARSSWGFSSQSVEAEAVEADVARSSWGFSRRRPRLTPRSWTSPARAGASPARCRVRGRRQADAVVDAA